MSNEPLTQKQFCSKIFVDRIKDRQEDIHRWLNSHENSKELPLYSSVDIRDAGFKIAVIDTNLFPAGFNNLCEHGILDSIKFIRQAILDRVSDCEDILIVVEEHTRNTWYLENIRILQHIIEQAGFKTRITTFFEIQPAFCESANYIELETATQNPVRIYCFKKILANLKAGLTNADLVILNNDLTTGIPEVLKELKIPIYPSIQAGWHSRQKSFHFQHTDELMKEFGEIIGMDPWIFSGLFTVVDQVNINIEADRENLKDHAADLFKRIQAKYKEHAINEKPFIFMKSDSGTYGMGVMAIEDPSEITMVNRKDKNKLYKGKGAQIINRYLLQEGIPTIHNIENEVSEVCIYQIENNLVGGFYRSNSQKSGRENLNSKGMEFKKMCPHSKQYGDCGVNHNMNIFDIYRVLARIAGIAAHREIQQLEINAK